VVLTFFTFGWHLQALFQLETPRSFLFRPPSSLSAVFFRPQSDPMPARSPPPYFSFFEASRCASLYRSTSLEGWVPKRPPFFLSTSFPVDLPFFFFLSHVS